MEIRTVSRYFGAAVLVLGPAAALVGTAVEPGKDGDSVATQVANAAAHPGTTRALLLADVCSALLLPAMLYLMRLARRGSPRFAVSGGVVAFVGWLAALMGLVGSDLYVYHAAKLADRAQAVALVKAATDDSISGALTAMFVVGHIVGMLLLGLALWRARSVPRWAALLVGLAPALHLVVHAAAKPFDVATYALLVVGMAGCALALLRTGEEQWDLPAAATQTPVPIQRDLANEPAGG